MRRRSLIAAGTAALFSSISSGQSERSAFKNLKLAQVPQDAGILRELTEQSEKDFLFVPPLFRYRISVSTQGRIEDLNEDDLDTLTKWGTFTSRPDFVAHFEKKVEVHDEQAVQWLFWQKALVQPFREELSQGGQLSVNTLLIGARRRQPLLLAIGFQSQ